MLYLGWILAAFLGGILLTLHIGRREKPTLRQRFSAIDRYEGLRYDDILQTMKVVLYMTERTAKGGTLRTWSEDGYSITLTFDADNVCLGVAEERY